MLSWLYATSRSLTFPSIIIDLGHGGKYTVKSNPERNHQRTAAHDFDPEKVAAAETAADREFGLGNVDAALSLLANAYEELFGVDRSTAEKMAAFEILAVQKSVAAGACGPDTHAGQERWQHAENFRVNRLRLLKSALRKKYKRA